MPSVGEIATLTQSRGGWEGVISEQISATLYQVMALTYDDRIHGNVIVHEADIASTNTNFPTYSVGDKVSLYRLRGEITAINGTQYTVKIEQRRNKDIVFTRDHVVPRWRLYIENN